MRSPQPPCAAPLTRSALPQVILCFSPVGSTLRVRARRFPAVVNCTAIDWFHEWPEDALVSVSSRFLEETGDIEVSWDPGTAHAAPCLCAALCPGGSGESGLLWGSPAPPLPLLQHARGWGSGVTQGCWGKLTARARACSPTPCRWG